MYSISGLRVFILYLDFTGCPGKTNEPVIGTAVARVFFLELIFAKFCRESQWTILMHSLKFYDQEIYSGAAGVYFAAWVT